MDHGLPTRLNHELLDAAATTWRVLCPVSGKVCFRNRTRFQIMQSHTVKGATILGTIPDLPPVIPLVRSHHERWDGKGYPDGSVGEAVPHLARIVAVADTFDAIMSDRPYRNGMAAETAFAEVQKQAGTQLDSQDNGIQPYPQRS